jgi:hypothetical protein
MDRIVKLTWNRKVVTVETSIRVFEGINFYGVLLNKNQAPPDFVFKNKYDGGPVMNEVYFQIGTWYRILYVPRKKYRKDPELYQNMVKDEASKRMY